MAPFSTFEAASLVIGQNTFASNSSDVSSTTLGDPLGIAFDSSGNLWVADYGNYRVLEYGGSSAAVASTSTTSTSSTTATASGSTSHTTTSSTLSSSSLSHASSTSSTTTSTSSSSQSKTSSGSGSGGGVPEFPYQLVIATVFTVLLATSYLFVRHRAKRRGH